MTTKADVIKKYLLEGCKDHQELIKKVQKVFPDDSEIAIKSNITRIMNKIKKGHKNWNVYKFVDEYYIEYKKEVSQKRKLKDELNDFEKDEIIDKIIAFNKRYKHGMAMNKSKYYKHSLEELQRHLNYMIKKYKG